MFASTIGLRAKPTAIDVITDFELFGRRRAEKTDRDSSLTSQRRRIPALRTL
jgi:hypothetical protein